MISRTLITFSLGCLSLLIPSCAHRNSIKKLTISQRAMAYHQEYEAPPITIWVHGTRFIRRPIFHNFFNGTPSLRLAQELAPDYYLHKVAKTLCKTAPQHFNPDTFYLFGWSGKLSKSAREHAGAALFDEIQRVIAAYVEKYHTKPFIRIITHSHGGSVALHMANIRGNSMPFVVDELVLLACPVQKSTQACVEDDMFAHTISLYSSLDMVQVIAPQIIYNVFRTKKGNLKSRMGWPPFSKRRFAEHPKLAQVKVKINGRALFHTEFTDQRFAKLLPHIIHVMKSWQANNFTPYGTHLLCVYTRPDEEIILPGCELA